LVGCGAENGWAVGLEGCQAAGVTAPVLAAAVRNNADWCALVCRSHGIPSSFGETVWRSGGGTPAYYPDAVTLRPDAAAVDCLPEVGSSAGYSVKDSFAALDLTSYGFVELFEARWIYRAAGLPVAATGLRGQPVATGAELRDWQTAWHGGEEAPDVFRPALLDDPSVVVLALSRGDELVGGGVLNRSAGVVGLSNVFAVGGGDVGGVWVAAIGAAEGYWPGLGVVGYERGEDLGCALESGFGEVGALRVWVVGE
jgi:hypothetical protein